MAVPLNDVQLEILKLFSHEQTEEEVNEIKSLLVTYLAHKVTREADKAFDEKGYNKKFLSNGRKSISVKVHKDDSSN